MTNFDPDDPRLTAYALGELEGDERLAVEQLLAADPEAVRTVRALRELGGLLTASLASEPPPVATVRLNPEQHRAIADCLGQAPPLAAAARPAGDSVTPGQPGRAPRHRTAWSSWRPLALAASTLLAGGAALLVWATQDGARSPQSAPDGSVFGRVGGAVAPSALPPASRSPSAGAALDAIADGSPPRSFELRFDAPAAGAPAPADSRPMPGGPPLAQAPAMSPAPVVPGSPMARPPLPQGGGMAGAPADMLLASPVVADAPTQAGTLATASNQPPATTPMFGGLSGARGASAPEGYPRSRRADAGTAAAGGPSEDRLAELGEAVTDSKSNSLTEGAARTGLSDPARGGEPAREALSARVDRRSEAVSNLAVVPAGARSRGLQEGDRNAPMAIARYKTQLATKPGEPRPEPGGRDAVPLALDQAGSPAKQAKLEAGQADPNALVPELKQAMAAAVPPVVAEAEVRQRNERFLAITENAFERVTAGHNRSTFGADVDTASYAIVRRDLARGIRPAPESVRVEELINAFDYEYAAPAATDKTPFAVHTEVIRCPWNPEHELLRIGLKGRRLPFADRKPSNLVFLVDVSGSMTDASKLPLVKAGLRMLAGQLGEQDRIAIVTYAGETRVWLPSTGGHQQATILNAIDRLTPGGSTNGAAGLSLAYLAAQEGFIPGGINRVILATDGDFNVGVTDETALEQLAAEKAKSGVFLSVLGVGEGNLKDSTMKRIANHGNGQYHYLDSLLEARRVLVEQVGGTLQTIAKDVKIQVEFDPDRVGAYRLIGYEARALANADFENDAKDAGEIGSEHSVTALYELSPPGAQAAQILALPAADAPADPEPVRKIADQLAIVRLRYKAPEAAASEATQEFPVPATVHDLGTASRDTKFAAAVAEFGLLLRGSQYAGQATLDAVLELARANLGPDPSGRRAEFVTLVEQARSIERPAAEAQPAAPPAPR